MRWAPCAVGVRFTEAFAWIIRRTYKIPYRVNAKKVDVQGLSLRLMSPLRLSGMCFSVGDWSRIIIYMVTQPTDDDKARLISLSEAAEMFGFNPRYLGELARKGRLGAQKVGHNWVTTPQDMNDFIRSRQRKGAFRDDIAPN